ncbi:alpha/beta hydrolase [Lentibacter algarum]|uniref:alpha/beta fold hydrolase n=1 Tax=Lentibacter algarum TaxID=576131 RepID=UPI001C094B38|nr:alpha/beta hydrolase [Lentibacter algarum]MBU2982809.1 alpha/beta hydrolase [Lentibacter algarum]
MPEFVTSDKLRLYFTDEGEGTPIVCLAGLTRTHRDFDFVAPHLEGVRLIRLDYRGRGRSDWADPASYTPLVEAGDVLELLDHLDIGQAGILGTSRGGLIAMTIAAMAPARLLGVALNDIGPVLNQVGLERIGTFIGKKPSHKSYAALLEVWPDLAQGFDNVPLSRFREEIVRLYHETDAGLELTYDPALQQGVHAALESDPVDLWPFFNALKGLPLCALRGANSNLLSAETFAEMQTAIPQMIAAEVADRGHVPYLDEPEALAALKQWIDQL